MGKNNKWSSGGINMIVKNQNLEGISKRCKLLKIFLFILFIFYFPIPYSLLPISCLYGAFEETGTGARPNSMGNAFSAFTDSIYSIYYNPAGLGFLNQAQLVAEYTKFYQGLDDGSDISKGYFAFGLPVKKDYLSFGFSYQKLSFIDVYSEEIMRLAFGIKPKHWFGTGIAFKTFSQKYEIEKNPYYETNPLFENGNTSSSFDFDFGLCFRPFNFLNFGLGSSNILQSEYGLSQNSKVKLARNDKFGIMYNEETMKIGLDFKQINYFYGEKNSDTKSKQNQQLNIGVEKKLKPLALRFGFSWGINYQYKNISAGLGINLSGIEIDYGWVFPLSGIEEISGTHHFSLVAKFGKKQEEKKVKVEKTVIETVKEETPVESEQIKLPVISTSAVVLPVQEIPVISTSVFVEPIISTVAVSPTPQVSVVEEPKKELPVLAKPVEILLEEPSIPVEEKPVETKTPETGVEIEQELKPEEKVSMPVIEVPKTEIPKLEISKIEVQKKKTSVPKVIITGPRTHKVKQGDTLISLAEKYYKDKRKWTKIYKANEDKIQKGTLKPDTVLIIP